MPKLIVLLSGRICTGKSTLAEALKKGFGFETVSTREFLRAREQDLKPERGEMQNYGEWLDGKTRGAWVRDDLAIAIENLPADAMLVVDSIRAKCQIDRLRESYRPIVVHVHLDCSHAVLERRYKKRKSKNLKEFASFAETMVNKTEAAVPELKNDADICIRTDYSAPYDVVTRVACHLGLRGREYSPHVDVIVGGQYGSEGKGQIAAFLAPEYDLLVRVGGPNAGHKVFEDDEPYTFHQLPSGTRCSEANLLIGPGAAIRLDVLLTEIAQCKVDCERLAIDPQAIIINKKDMEWEAKRLKGTISSTAQGTGHAMMRRIERRDGTLFAEGVRQLRPFIRPALAVLEEARVRGRRVLLEGTQGTGLSIYHGHYPYVTSRDTTVAGCLSEAGIPPRCVRKVVMVCRTYPIRVQSPTGGTSGYMSQEISLPEIARRSRVPLAELRRTERTSTTNRKRRIAEFDWEQFRRSASLNAPTDIALTFADYLDVTNREARRFDQLTQPTLLFIHEAERVAGAPISLVSVGFNHRAVLDHRYW
jgi:adenylosuccinate synthase